MSDIKLFRLTQGQATELQGDASDLEKPLQTLIENNLDSYRRVQKRAGTKSSSMKSFRQVDSQLKNIQKRIESSLSWEDKATMHLCTMKRGLKSIESR